MTSARRSLLLFCVASLLVAACGGAPDAKAPESMVSEPSTVEEAQAQIARARSELGGDPSPRVSADAAPATPPPPPPAPAPQASRQTEDQKKTMESAPSGAAEGQCSSPCRALASMRRAVTALCRMTGDEDARCRDARKTLQSSEARVTPCAC